MNTSSIQNTSAELMVPLPRRLDPKPSAERVSVDGPRPRSRNAGSEQQREASSARTRRSDPPADQGDRTQNRSSSAMPEPAKHASQDAKATKPTADPQGKPAADGKNPAKADAEQEISPFAQLVAQLTEQAPAETTQVELPAGAEATPTEGTSVTLKPSTEGIVQAVFDEPINVVALPMVDFSEPVQLTPAPVTTADLSQNQAIANGMAPKQSGEPVAASQTMVAQADVAATVATAEPGVQAATVGEAAPATDAAVATQVAETVQPAAPQPVQDSVEPAPQDTRTAANQAQADPAQVVDGAAQPVQAIAASTTPEPTAQPFQAARPPQLQDEPAPLPVAGEDARTARPQVEFAPVVATTAAGETPIVEAETVATITPTQTAQPAATIADAAPTAGPAMSPMEQALETPQAGDQIVQAMRARTLANGDEITVRLDPPELGRVKISIQSDADGIRGVVQAENARTLSELQRETPSLVQRLAESGVDIRRVEFQLADSSSSATSGQSDPSAQQSGQNGQFGPGGQGRSGGQGEGGHARGGYDDLDAQGSYVRGDVVTDQSINVMI